MPTSRARLSLLFSPRPQHPPNPWSLANTAEVHEEERTEGETRLKGKPPRKQQVTVDKGLWTAPAATMSFPTEHRHRPRNASRPRTGYTLLDTEVSRMIPVMSKFTRRTHPATVSRKILTRRNYTRRAGPPAAMSPPGEHRRLVQNASRSRTASSLLGTENSQEISSRIDFTRRARQAAVSRKKNIGREFTTSALPTVASRKFVTRKERIG